MNGKRKQEIRTTLYIRDMRFIVTDVCLYAFAHLRCLFLYSNYVNQMVSVRDIVTEAVSINIREEKWEK